MLSQIIVRRLSFSGGPKEPIQKLITNDNISTDHFMYTIHGNNIFKAMPKHVIKR